MPGSPHRLEVKVRFYELDPYGHLNHSVFIQYFEVARVELLSQVGMGLHEMSKRGLHVVVTSIETSFRRPVVAGDVVVVESEVEHIGRASSRWLQRMWREEVLVAEQKVRAAITDSRGRPVRAPDELVDRLAPFRLGATESS